MKINRYQQILAALAGASLTILSGCSVVGLGAGALIDKSTPDTRSVSVWNLANIDSDRRVGVILKDSTRCKCDVVALAEMPQDQYEEIYSKSVVRGGLPTGLPNMHDTIEVSSKKGKSGLYEFGGFGYGPRKMSRPMSPGEKLFPGSVYQFLTAKSLPDDKDRIFYLNDLSSISVDGGPAVVGTWIEKLLNNGALPLKSVVACRSYSDEKVYRMENIDSIEVRNKKSAKWVGLALGLAIDIAIVVSLSNFHYHIDLSGWETGMADGM